MGATLNPGGMDIGDLNNVSGYYDPNTGQWVNPPSNSNTTNPWDLPMYNGAYGAPLVQGQLDALQGYNQLFNSNPLVQTNDLRKAMELAIGGGSIFHPNQGKSLQESVSAFELPSQAKGVASDIATTGGGGYNQLGSSLGTALNAPSFDMTQLFKTGEDVFKSNLNEGLARTREEASGFGLTPGSSDREGALMREYGSQLNNFRLGQQQLGAQSFENAENRRLGALGVGNQIAGGQANAQLGGANLLAGMENLPYQRYYQMGTDAANRSLQQIPSLMQMEQQPFDRFIQQFGLNEQARQIGDTEAQRMLGEFGRTQGGGLQQLLAILSGTPMNNTGIGPSIMSQFGQMIAGIIPFL